ncbi:thiol-disulfide oxidoreductase DCC family protein [Myroides guanonis]|uniref:Predicted thiol-disulfide oxidoreductase YuxK, DCC family n=1 Tax=Myroides guanonis TaxID=1150112 RepID=A0A1I3RWY2_9FLAO|nr:DCC1-like thiol-disulfide oxidoreductase family protein [Myroides guanonis]SFJ49837.1 Predicted thiol-disulfide oxidoreductase YuxK, DCC family [Myroides guanonis]
METWPRNKKIILFDGVCNLCDTTIQKVIKADTKDQFRFASLDSNIGKAILDHIGVDREKTDSMVLYVPGEAYYIKSEAAIKIATYLGGLYGLLQPLSIFPKNLTDSIYNYVAKNRYKWYGKKESCMVPTPELREKFL